MGNQPATYRAHPGSGSSGSGAQRAQLKLVGRVKAESRGAPSTPPSAGPGSPPQTWITGRRQRRTASVTSRRIVSCWLFAG